MWLKELYKRCTGRTAIGRRPHPPAARRHRLRLSLEQLEDRTVPSVGTAADTVLVKDFNRGSASSSIYSTVDLNGTLLLTVNDGTSTGLWKSDGTAAGTVLIKAGGGSTRITVVGGTAFFVADEAATGNELWKTDGTAAGTILVKDINPGPGSSSPSAGGNVNGTLFFSGYDPVHGRELWKSDGTAAGTVLVKDINPGTGDGGGGFGANVNGTWFFVASDGTQVGLWKSDGTAAGTVLVKSGMSAISELTNVNGTLFFVANDSHGRELWKSDGTAKGTKMVKDINSGTSASRGGIGGPGHSDPVAHSSNPQGLVDFNGTLFFIANDGEAHGYEMWKSDGTAKGTVLVTDLYPSFTSGVRIQEGKRLTIVTGMLFFSGNGPTTGWQLWKSDGTAAGTVVVKQIDPDSDSLPENLTNANGTLFFSASDGTHGRELWRSDGTAAGTVLVKDINPGIAESNPALLTLSGGHLFFTADDGVHGVELWDPPVEPASGAAVPATALGDANSADVQRDLARARRATARYHDLDAALADGFVNTGLPCIEGQGFHYVNPGRIGTLDVDSPQVLVYAPGNRLVGLEWIMPASLVGGVPPTLFGETFHGSAAGGLFFLHVWAWQANPDGMFADSHPLIHCEDAAGLAHEIDHLLDQDHAVDGVMIDILATGIRRLPGDEADWLTAVDVLFAETSLDKRRW